MQSSQNNVTLDSAKYQLKIMMCEYVVVCVDLMRESRLSFTQKNVFDTILRSGRSLPENPSHMNSQLRQTYMQQRHKYKARLMGVPVIEEEAQPLSNYVRARVRF